MQTCFQCGAWFTDKRPFQSGLCIWCEDELDRGWARDLTDEDFTHSDLLRLQLALQKNSAKFDSAKLS